MGALKNIGIDLDSDSFQRSFINSVVENIEKGRKPSIAFLDLNFGFDVDLPTGENAKILAEGFKTSSISSDSQFKKTFIPMIKKIFDLLDSIPAINILKALPVPITDPTKPLLPVANLIVEILSNLGIDNPNQFFLQKLDNILGKKDELVTALEKLKSNNQDRVNSGIDKIATIFNEIDERLQISVIKNNIINNIEKIKSLIEIPDDLIPDLIIPEITDVISFFNIQIPEIIFEFNLKIQEIIKTLFDLNLELPPIGTMFVELLKIKLKILSEVVLASTPAAILNPPDFLIAAINEIKKILTGQFSIKEFLKAIVRSFFSKFFIEIEKTKIKKLVENAPTLVSVLHSIVLTLIGSLTVLVVGILIGEGFIMKSSAIGLGILK